MYTPTTDAVTPTRIEAQVGDPRMHLTGILRERGGDYLLEEQLATVTDTTRWTTPRLYLLQVTPETQEAVLASIGQIVTVSGIPVNGGKRQPTAIVLDRVQPVALEATVR